MPAACFDLSPPTSPPHDNDHRTMIHGDTGRKLIYLPWDRGRRIDQATPESERKTGLVVVRVGRPTSSWRKGRWRTIYNTHNLIFRNEFVVSQYTIGNTFISGGQ